MLVFQTPIRSLVSKQLILLVCFVFLSRPPMPGESSARAAEEKITHDPRLN